MPFHCTTGCLLGRRPQERVARRCIGWKIGGEHEGADAERDLVQDMPLRIESAVSVADWRGILRPQSREPVDLPVEVGNKRCTVRRRRAGAQYRTHEAIKLLRIGPCRGQGREQAPPSGSGNLQASAHRRPGPDADRK